MDDFVDGDPKKSGIWKLNELQHGRSVTTREIRVNIFDRFPSNESAHRVCRRNWNMVGSAESDQDLGSHVRAHGYMEW